MGEPATVTGRHLWPFGYTLDETDGVFYFCTACACRELRLNLYQQDKLMESFAFPGEDRLGDVFTMGLMLPRAEGGLSYTYTADGVEFPDPYGREFSGHPHFGERSGFVLRARIPETDPEYAEERQEAAPKPQRSFEQSVIYRLHVRGFTMDKSSGVPEAHRGRFSGIADKIPYLKELGVTGIELLPPYEFTECIGSGEKAEGKPQWDRTPGYLSGVLPGMGEGAPGSGKRPEDTGAKPKGQPLERINYWGFTADALRFAPKEAYGGARELTALSEALHKEGMELYADLYFDGSEPVQYACDLIRTWVFDYGADGVHLIGAAPLREVLSDPYLREVKIFAEQFSGIRLPQRALREAQAGAETGASGTARTEAEYNRGFQNTMRRFLKGDEGMLPEVQERMLRNPSDRGQINYIANTDGFTLLDFLSYDHKHNEENGEQNTDGTDENYSWSCGEEGPTRKKTVRRLREKQYKNAVLLTALSQGTPLFCAGDEFGHSKKGNNNTWCQDNALEWLDWRLLEKNRGFCSFVKEVLSLRRAHPVFRQPFALRGSDYLMKGIPDVSWHGETAWKADTEPYRRQIGILYNGAYAQAEDGGADQSFYLCCNMHWEPHGFALPAPKKGMCWRLLIDTDSDARKGTVFAEEREVLLAGRSSVLLESIPEKAAAGCRDTCKKEKSTGKRQGLRNGEAENE